MDFRRVLFRSRPSAAADSTYFPRFLISGLHLILFQKIVKRWPADPQHLGCAGNIALSPGNGAADRLPVSHFPHGLQIDDVSRILILAIKVEIRSEEHTSELQSLMRISYAVFCLKKKKTKKHTQYS